MLGVSTVERIIARNDYLESQIQSNDREPSWDGFIYTYHHAGDTHSKSDLAGRVPIQIKGHGCSDIEKERKIFRVEISHLRNYLQDGGIIFLVVFISDDQEVIYYNTLLPYNLHILLKEHGNQKKCTLYLEPFPQNQKEIADLFFNFIRNRDKQRIINNSELFSIEDLCKEGLLNTLSFGFTTVNPDYREPIDYFFDHDMFLYADLSFLGLSYPVEYIQGIEIAIQEIEADISIDGKHFYDSYKIVYKKECHEIYFGKSLKVIYSKLDEEHKCIFKLKGTLAERIVDLEFWINVLRRGGICIESQYVRMFSFPEEKIKKLDITHMMDHLAYLKKIQKVFTTFRVKRELDFEQMQKHDEENLRKLIYAICDKKPVALSISDSIVGKYTIANINLLVLALKDEESGLFKIYDFFNSPIPHPALDTNGIEYPASVCIRLSSEDLLLYDNIDYDKIIDSLKAVPFSENFLVHLFRFLDRILSAYDTLNLVDHPLLGFAKDVLGIIESYEDEPTCFIVEIDHFQIIKREREYDDQEKTYLEQLVMNPTLQEHYDLLASVYLLLDDQEKAKHCYDKMPMEEQQMFIQLPVYKYKTWN